MTAMKNRRQAGMSLIEVSVASGIVSVLLFAATSVANRSFTAAQNMDRASDLERKGQTAMETICAALTDAGRTTLDPLPLTPYGSSTLQFRPAAGYTAGTVTWKDPSVIAWRESSKDPENGLDDDNDGIVDDGEVVLRRNVGTGSENLVLLARGVPARAPGELVNSADDNGDGLRDERGLSFVMVKNGIRVRLATARIDAEKKVITRMAERIVALKN
jgi:prepilin-type N-terminal cleavage/methylation domain-containing protein